MAWRSNQGLTPVKVVWPLEECFWEGCRVVEREGLEEKGGCCCRVGWRGKSGRKRKAVTEEKKKKRYGGEKKRGGREFEREKQRVIRRVSRLLRKGRSPLRLLSV